MRADKPRRAAEADDSTRSSHTIRKLAKRGAVVALVSGIGFATLTAFTASSTTATAVTVQTPLGISTLGGGITASAEAVSPEQLAAQRTEVLDEQADEISAAAADAAASTRESALSQDASSLATENERLRNLAKFLWPTKGDVSSPFGLRLHPILHYYRMHDGDDIGGTCGQEIWAAQSGTVTRAEMGYNGGSGNNVWIDNGDINGVNVASGYLHMKSYIVKIGEYVEKGQVIGYVGNTGLSTACHLHFSIKKDGRQSNPMEFIGWNTESAKTDDTSADS